MGKIMIKAFINQNYLIIESNVVTNVTVWNGDTSTWTPPIGSIALIQSTTSAMVWELNFDKTDYVLTESIGAGAIGFTWDGSSCITNEPKPVVPIQPTNEGIQTL